MRLQAPPHQFADFPKNIRGAVKAEPRRLPPAQDFPPVLEKNAENIDDDDDLMFAQQIINYIDFLDLVFRKMLAQLLSRAVV